MPKEEWGVKRVCPTTGKRFYDLGRNPIVSPYTGEVVTLDTGNKSRVLIKDVKEKVVEPDEDVLIEDDADVLDADADVDLDDDVLDEDADDDSVSFDDLAEVEADDEES
ncbi:TIGR02300 family protein [Tropicimonas sp. IMCC34043]|uniref:TIGR02300 family protein n=1 Tax=Tropicimonas sp. IMCC34043 TaxID=2248760 RepID=UPI000E229F3E|nr:TIGR02300 family protein [Tropicimonas sp. IMCC34043]